ncbi:MAG: 1-phosphofructokinase family hexose kinase [Corynebacterium sp.]|uniref:1-phosphofructokinase family hexose kinase n=1 Tax=Corynebacterium sp. TaxID=1720 RepID=UPI0026DBABA7|nr:1-phosphofructokinase family hexose kinase [Corynebacterium sp.]MDO5099130.1 1-phosphofructokinase family hexose kinase [Corynebacterium sp.]
MIITATPNPSVDSTFQLTEKLIPGTVMRLSAAVSVAGGKGINVAHAVHNANKATTAIFPASQDDPFVGLVQEVGLPFVTTPTDFPVRVNTTLADPDGETTKLNGIGAQLSTSDLQALEAAIVAQAQSADWVVLAGSLPPGVSADWYTHVIELLRTRVSPAPKIAVDTSNEPLLAIANALPDNAPTLLTPNSIELGQIIGAAGDELEKAAMNGDYLPVVSAANQLVEKGVEMALITLGAAGAVLATTDGAWVANTPKTQVVSTVGAGDCALAGFVMGQAAGLNPADSLALGVAYGRAAVMLPGTTIPTPELIDTSAVTVRPSQTSAEQAAL